MPKNHDLPTNLAQWLAYIESIHAIEIDMSLERISQVFKRLNIHFNHTQVITVAGTNGKGTSCAFIEQALLLLTQSVAVYSSPHIHTFNERLRINGLDTADELWIAAFEKVEHVRADISLSYYEFTTLAALIIAAEQKLDYLILEVGLGGRLDATNVVDADVAVITSIDIDHTAFLGDTREQIGIEKAGIMRKGKPCILGEANIPQAVIDYGNQVAAQLVCRGNDFTLEQLQNTLTYRCGEQHFVIEQPASIPLDNIATAITTLLQFELPLSNSLLDAVVAKTKLPGRMEWFHHSSDILLDVGHNPHAIRLLKKSITPLLEQQYQQVYAVTSMLADKDIESCYQTIAPQVAHWFIAPLSQPRAASVQRLQQALKKCDVDKQQINCFDNLQSAFKMAVKKANESDLILVFGSFFTVEQVRCMLVQE